MQAMALTTAKVSKLGWVNFWPSRLLAENVGGQPTLRR